MFACVIKVKCISKALVYLILPVLNMAPNDTINRILPT